MKKIIALAVFAACTITLNAQTKLKLGWVNSTELLEVMPEKKKAAASLDSMVKAEESVLKLLEDDYKRVTDNLNKKGATMPPDELKRAQEELGKIEDALYSQMQLSQDKVQQREKDLINPILDKIANAIKEVGKENGYNYIFDVSLQQVLVYPDGDNVLKLVKKKLGIPVMD